MRLILYFLNSFESLDDLACVLEVVFFVASTFVFLNIADVDTDLDFLSTPTRDGCFFMVTLIKQTDVRFREEGLAPVLGYSR